MSQMWEQFTYWLGQNSRSGMTWLFGLDQQGWLILLACAALFGLFCMRGFGSRENY